MMSSSFKQLKQSKKLSKEIVKGERIREEQIVEAEKKRLEFVPPVDYSISPLE